MRERQRETRAMETDDEREVRLERQRHRQREIRDVETAEQREERLKIMRERQIERTAMETAEQSKERLLPVNSTLLESEFGVPLYLQTYCGVCGECLCNDIQSTTSRRQRGRTLACATNRHHVFQLTLCNCKKATVTTS